MNRIQEVTIINTAYRSPYVTFRDALDIEHSLTGKTYRPSYAALEILRRLARHMTVDMKFSEGVTVLTRKDTTK